MPTVNAMDTVSSCPDATNAIKEKTETNIGAHVHTNDSKIVFHRSDGKDSKLYVQNVKHASIPRSIHLISFALAFSVRSIHRSSQAQSLINFTLANSSFKTAILLSRAAEMPRDMNIRRLER